MPDKTETSSETANTQQPNKSPLRAAYARLKLLPISWSIVAGALIGVVILGLTAYFLPNMKERMKFFTDSALAWLVFVIVAVQAYIYRRQWEVMENQWESVKEQVGIMRDQARSMDQSVVFGLRAYVGIGSIRLDLNKKRLFIEIENIGKVPAKNIQIRLVLRVEIPREFFSSVGLPSTTTRPFQFVQIDTGADYGDTKLFPGRLPIIFMVRLDEEPISSDQYALITAGHARLMIHGNIRFMDGFNSGKNTPFAFRYFLRDKLWTPYPVRDPESESSDQQAPSVNTYRFS